MSPDSHAPRTMGPFPNHVKPCHRVTCTPDAPLSACMGAITVTPVFWRHPPGHGNSNLTSGAYDWNVPPSSSSFFLFSFISMKIRRISWERNSKYDEPEIKSKINDLWIETIGTIGKIFFFFTVQTLRKTTCLPRSPNFHDLHLCICVEFIGNQVS